MIEFRNVSKRFGMKQVLDNLTFSVRRGEIVFLLGRSGAGKSVALKHLVGLMHPDAGEIRVDGRLVSRLPEQEYFDIRRKCGMVFQFPALLDSLSVYENIAFGMRAHALCTGEQERAWVVEKLKLVGLGESVLTRFPAELSFGMQKRVSIARTIATHPAYLLFDEPTTSLDPVTTRCIHELIRRLCRTLHATALVVSHDMAGALCIADRIALIDGGKIVDEGIASEMQRSKHPLTRAFLKNVQRSAA